MKLKKINLILKKNSLTEDSEINGKNYLCYIYF